MVIFGVDIARTGADKTVVAIRQDMAIIRIIRWGNLDTMETTGRIVQLYNRYKPEQMVIDVIGIGAGVVDRLRELNLPVIPFNASERAEGSDMSGELTFLNKRAHAWWCMRELLDPMHGKMVQLPNDELLIRDLITPRWKTTSAGKIQIEAKEDIAKRLSGNKVEDIGRSTDCGDAVIMAFYEGDRSSFEEGYGVFTRESVDELRSSLRPEPPPTEEEILEGMLWMKANSDGQRYSDS